MGVKRGVSIRGNWFVFLLAVAFIVSGILVSYYDNKAGTVTGNVVSSASLAKSYSFSNDSVEQSGNLFGGARIVSDGLIGSALALNGTQYSDVGDVHGGKFYPPETKPLFIGWYAVTVQAWIKTSQAINGQIVVAKHAGGPVGEYYLALFGNNLKMMVINDTGGYSGGRVDCMKPGFNFNFADGMWHNVAGVYDGSNITLYVDGNFIVSCVQTGKIAFSTIPIKIGAYNVTSDTYWNFNGSIDEVLIYSTNLSAADIRSNFIEQNSSRVQTPSAPLCNDSDGMDDFTQGFVNFSGTIYNDFCYNSSVLTEHYCLDSDDRSSINVSCEFGCSDGACIASDEDSFCADSDFGKNYTVFGNSSDSLGEYEDVCYNESVLTERYCSNNFVANYSYTCRNGFICDGGACVLVGDSLSGEEDSNVFSVSGIELSSGVEKRVKVAEKVKFNLLSQDFFIEIISVEQDKVVITDIGGQVRITLNLGDEKKFDLDGDGTYDVVVELRGVINDQANLYLKAISEQVAFGDSNGESLSGVANDTSQGGDSGGSGSYWVIGLIVLFILIILGIIIWVVMH